MSYEDWRNDTTTELTYEQYKKAQLDWYSRVKQWNEDRENLSYNPALEFRMLQEELKEYSDGVSLLDKTEQVDAICDLIFVAMGTLAKMANEWDFDGHLAMEYVLQSNEAKPKERVNGKIIKGDKWQDPKAKIKAILRGN